MARAKKSIVCSTTLALPRHQWLSAAAKAVKINPANSPRKLLSMAQPGFTLQPEHLALITSTYWGAEGVSLTVGFLDNPPTDLRARILSHMNAWNKTANVNFVETTTDPQVRISRLPGLGYSSYVGTDILGVPSDQHTMNLEEFTMQTPDSEFHRVVRHETGHTLGFAHEHLRAELVARIDRQKAIDYFGGPPNYWKPEEVIANVLTPLPASDITATETADQDSIMCYQLSGDITVDGQPILGGTDIDDADYAFAALLYPKPDNVPKNVPPTPASASQLGLEDFLAAAARAGMRSIQPQPLPPGAAVPATRPRIFIGIVASDE
jgi:hypothetical protein